MEEQRLREEEIIREKEEEWRRREHGAEKTVEWDTWPTYEYELLFTE
jgi:hypothetical protein